MRGMKSIIIRNKDGDFYQLTGNVETYILCGNNIKKIKKSKLEYYLKKLKNTGVKIKIISKKVV